jgi:gliding motility-associated-like protein
MSDMKSASHSKINFTNELRLIRIAFLLVSFIVLISIKGLGQGSVCVNGPTVRLSSSNGSTCGTTAVTISGNTFGGSATQVKITENGDGSLSQTTASKSPFSFTYTPGMKDIGKTIVITVTTNNPSGKPCIEAKATYSLSVNTYPTEPKAGTITHPTCISPTGSVVLSGLPSSGTWTINPGAIQGTGPNTTVSGLAAGTYRFSVISAGGCTSELSSNVVINAPPASPASPAQTADCSQGYGKAIVTVTTPTGSGLSYRLDGGTYQNSPSFVNVADGSHTVTVRNNSSLCTTTGASFPVSCGCAIPAAPSIGTRTHPTLTVATGSVILNGLPSEGTWTLIRSPGAVVTNGTGTSTTITGLAPGTYTFTVTSAAGCTSASSANVVIIDQAPTPTPPVIGTITQPTCAISTGSVQLTGLPSSGSWTVTRLPDGANTTASGTFVTLTGIPEGKYTFTVTNSSAYVSAPSAQAVINVQPATPTAPSVGTITPPTCASATGTVLMSGLPSTGTWTITRYPGTVITTGTGTSRTIPDLPSGTYNFTVTNEHSCLSVPSANVVIPAQPPTLTAPVIGTITQPTFSVPTGSVVLSGLPSSGTWTLTRYPGEITATGTGTSRTITGLPAGVFTFMVTNSAGCTSAASNQVIISTPGIPVLIITNPLAVCSPLTVNLTDPAITEGSTPGLTYTYWTNSGATVAYPTPQAAGTGRYYIKGTTVSGFFDIKPVIVTVFQKPTANAGPDQVLEYKFDTKLDAEISGNETGVWSQITAAGILLDIKDPKTSVTHLIEGKNIFRWTVTNGICPPVFDQVNITVNHLTIPTLITPNMDGKNDYLVLMSIETLGKTEITIFDRRGVLVYKNTDYDNNWNGVDFNNKPLLDDTYFYVLKTENGKSIKGFIVIRR